MLNDPKIILKHLVLIISASVSSHQVRNMCIIWSVWLGNAMWKRQLHAVEPRNLQQNQVSKWVEVMPGTNCVKGGGVWLTGRNAKRKELKMQVQKAVHGKRISNEQLQGNNHDSSSDTFGPHFGSDEMSGEFYVKVFDFECSCASFLEPSGVCATPKAYMGICFGHSISNSIDKSWQ